jgi:carboxymethylenebutenolidase
LALHGYLVEEITHDFEDGILTRREALRRLGLLGLTITGAAAILAACSGDKKPTAAKTATTATGAGTTAAASDDPPGSSAALKAEAVKFTGPAGELQGAFAAAKSPKGAVLVVHENRGLTQHFFDVTGRLAGAGYTALTVDLLSRKGGTAKVGDEAAAQAALGAAPLEELLADLRAGIGEVQKRTPDRKVGAVGFCFGGGMVWNLLNTGEDRLAAAAPFYGPAPENPNFDKAKAAVFAVYGATDTFVNPTMDRAVAAMKAAGLKHDIMVASGAGHAFFNNTGARYNAKAAQEAWSGLLAWFNTYL